MPGRSRAVAVFCAVAGLAAVMALPAAADRGEVLLWRLPLEARLDRPVSCRFEDTPFIETVAFFRGALEMNLVLDPSLEQGGLRPVSLDLREVPARWALRAVVRQAGLDYGLAEGAVYISTSDRVVRAEMADFRQYEVGDLLIAQAAFGGQGGFWGGQRQRGFTYGGGAGGGYGGYGQYGGYGAGGYGAGGYGAGGYGAGGYGQGGYGAGGGAGQDLMQLIILFTGPQNWDQVGVLGTYQQAGYGYQAQSRQDRF